MEEGIEIAKLAVDTGFWPLFEVEDGTWRLTHRPRRRTPIVEWIKRQRRFEHLFKGTTATP